MRRAVALTAVAGAVAIYATVSLWAPDDWQLRGWAVNRAELAPTGGIRFREPGIALARGSAQLIEAAMASHRLELSLRVRALAPDQPGPARILTLSNGPYESNLMVGQDCADLVVRLRTPGTTAIGTTAGAPTARVERLFLTSDWVDLHMVVEPRSLRIAVQDEVVVRDALPPRPLEAWEPSHRLALGNELTGTRPWLGEISRAVVRAADGSENYASELEIPSHFLITGPPPKLIPLHELNLEDAVKNFVFYVPLGFLLGFLIAVRRGGRHRRAAFAAVLVIAAISTSLEALQYLLVPGRWPSIDDVIFNMLGGGLGLLLAVWAKRLLCKREGDDRDHGECRTAADRLHG